MTHSKYGKISRQFLRQSGNEKFSERFYVVAVNYTFNMKVQPRDILFLVLRECTMQRKFQDKIIISA